MNTTIIFNVPPDTTGAFDPKDATLLQQFGTWNSELYQTDVLKGQPTTADSTWSAAGFDGSKAVDDSVCTYGAAAAGKTTGRLEVDPPTPVTFSTLSIREPNELGERSTAYHVEFKQNGTWNTAPKDKSGNQIQGTVIGQRQLSQLNQTQRRSHRLGHRLGPWHSRHCRLRSLLNLVGRGYAVGVFILTVPAASQAANDGLLNNDVIDQFNGQSADSLDDLNHAYAQTTAGQKIAVEIWRNQAAASMAMTR